MIYTDNTRKAINIAYNAHMGQVDKSGIPYIFHPYHLAEQMSTEEEIIVALLHDVVEDTNITIEELSKNFNNNIIEAINLLTKKDDNYETYINKISKNKIAKKVKIADLKHNLDITRITNPEEKDYQRITKYKKALEILNNNNT